MYKKPGNRNDDGTLKTTGHVTYFKTHKKGIDEKKYRENYNNIKFTKSKEIRYSRCPECDELIEIEEVLDSILNLVNYSCDNCHKKLSSVWEKLNKGKPKPISERQNYIDNYDRIFGNK